jgi:hypothetical protein
MLKGQAKLGPELLRYVECYAEIDGSILLLNLSLVELLWTWTDGRNSE